MPDYLGDDQRKIRPGEEKGEKEIKGDAAYFGIEVLILICFL